MPDFIQERLLILVKTYPSPSRTYRETTCVAAVTQSGQLRRLFPIPFRLLSGEAQFKKWQWIDARITKAPRDHRPESFKIDTDSIAMGEVIPTRSAWSERLAWIAPHLVGSFEQLEARRRASGETLGIIRPVRILKLEITPVRDAEWTEQDKEALLRQGLFDTPEQARRPPLEKLPFDFHYRYECNGPSGTIEHRHKLSDWEVGALFRNCRRDHGDGWEAPFRQKFEHELPAKDLLLVMGTIHRFPNQWLIIGLIYPPRTDTQPTLF